MSETPTFHEHLYSDLRRVRAARVQAEGRIALRKLNAAVLAPFERVAAQLAEAMDRVVKRR